MTHIEFHINAQDKLATAVRLVAAAYQAGKRVLVFAPERGVANRIDQMLWATPALSFVPHVAAASPLAKQTPVIIAGSLDDVEHDQMLVNLDGELPPSFARFERLVEIVGTDEDDRVPARNRFRFYRERGYPMTTHDLSAKE